MKWLWRVTGWLAWWCAWPAMWLYLRDSQRTRVLLSRKGGSDVLVVKGWLSANDRWEFPGGGLHKGEAPLHGLLREVREEIGLELEPKQVQPLMTSQVKSKGFRFNLHIYTASLSGTPTLKLQRFEIASAEWVDYHNLTVSNAEPDVLLAVQAWSGSSALLQ